MALVTLSSGHLGLPRSLGCSLVLTLSLEPSSGLLNTGNSKLVFLTCEVTHLSLLGSSVGGLHSRKSSGDPKVNDGCPAHGTCSIKATRLDLVLSVYGLLAPEPCIKPKGHLRTAQRLQSPGQRVGNPGLLLAWSLPSYRATILLAFSSSA